MREPADLVIRNARLLLESGMVIGGIGVRDGKICCVASDPHLPEASKTVDAKGKVLMPGLIDGHAHFHDPAMPSHEDFTSGSRAAAAGGVTTVVDMPLTSQVDTVPLVKEKIRQGERLSVIDFSLYAGMINSSNYTRMREMAGVGVVAFKAFTCAPYQANLGVIAKSLSEVSDVGGHLTVHAEDQGVLDEFATDMEGDWDAPISHSLSRPELAEYLAVKETIAVAAKTGGHLHIAHITTRDGLGEIERAKQNGVQVTTEVCPHHLMFNRDEMNQLGPKSKMNPPLRSREDRGALWSGLLRGVIDMTVSDHAPSPMPEKLKGSEDIRKAWAGVDGTQMILRVLLSEGMNKGRISLDRILQAGARNPAKIFGLYPKKGTIMVDSDADLVLVDPTVEQKIRADMMFSESGWTLYEGLTMKGAPVATYARGEPVFEDGTITAKPGRGRFCPMGGPPREAED